MAVELLLLPVQQRYGFEKAIVLDIAVNVYDEILLNGPSDDITTINKQAYSVPDHMRQIAAWQSKHSVQRSCWQRLRACL